MYKVLDKNCIRAITHDALHKIPCHTNTAVPGTQLAAKFCFSLFVQDLKAQAETMSWVMWQMGGLGPMQGQANHFVRYVHGVMPCLLDNSLSVAIDGKASLQTTFPCLCRYAPEKIQYGESCMHYCHD